VDIADFVSLIIAIYKKNAEIYYFLFFWLFNCGQQGLPALADHNKKNQNKNKK